MRLFVELSVEEIAEITKILNARQEAREKGREKDIKKLGHERPTKIKRKVVPELKPMTENEIRSRLGLTKLIKMCYEESQISNKLKEFLGTFENLEM